VPGQTSSVNIAELKEKCYAAMDDDFNTPVLISHLFDAVRIINSARDKQESLTASDLEMLKQMMHSFVFEVLGLKDESDISAGNEVMEELMNLIADIRKSARANKDWATSDKIRDELSALGFEIKDTKDGFEWRLN